MELLGGGKNPCWWSSLYEFCFILFVCFRCSIKKCFSKILHGYGVRDQASSSSWLYFTLGCLHTTRCVLPHPAFFIDVAFQNKVNVKKNKWNEDICFFSWMFSPRWSQTGTIKSRWDSAFLRLCDLCWLRHADWNSCRCHVTRDLETANPLASGTAVQIGRCRCGCAAMASGCRLTPTCVLQVALRDLGTSSAKWLLPLFLMLLFKAVASPEIRGDLGRHDCKCALKLVQKYVTYFSKPFFPTAARSADTGETMGIMSGIPHKNWPQLLLSGLER